MLIKAFKGRITVPVVGLGTAVNSIDIMESIKPIKGNFDTVETGDYEYFYTKVSVKNPLKLAFLDQCAVVSHLLPIWFYDDSKGDIEVYIEIQENLTTESIKVYMSFPFAEKVDRDSEVYHMEFDRVREEFKKLLNDEKFNQYYCFESVEEMADYYTGEFEQAVDNGEFSYFETVVELSEMEINAIKEYFRAYIKENVLFQQSQRSISVIA